MDKEIENNKIMDKNKSKKQVTNKISGKKSDRSTSKKDIKPAVNMGAEVFNSLNGKFLLVRVGDDKKRAEDKDIEQIEKKLTALLEENNVNCLAFVTHHAVDITVI